MTKIILATEKELSIIAPLFDAYRQFYGQKADLEGAAMFLRERILQKESTIFLAIDHDGEAMGFVQLFPIFTSVGMNRALLLNDLYVDQKFRQKGVGAALMNHSKQHAQTIGASWVMLQTEASNKTAQSLYEKSGYTKTSDFFYFLDTKK